MSQVLKKTFRPMKVVGENGNEGPFTGNKFIDAGVVNRRLNSVFMCDRRDIYAFFLLFY